MTNIIPRVSRARSVRLHSRVQLFVKESFVPLGHCGDSDVYFVEGAEAFFLSNPMVEKKIPFMIETG